MNANSYQKLRRSILLLLLICLPITFNLMSPVLIIFAGLDRTINMSFIIFSIWLISSVFFGRGYCSVICQWGAMQEIYGILNSKPLTPNPKRWSKILKYIIFVVWMFFVLFPPLIAGGYLEIQPWFPNSINSPGNWASFDATVPMSLIFYFGIQFLIVGVFSFGIGNRSFCKYACPMGVLGIIGQKISRLLKIPSLHLKANKDNCIRCKKCNQNCPMSLDVMEMIQMNEMVNVNCILCGSCIAACKKQHVISTTWKWI